MHSHDDELLVLAEALGEVKTKTEKLEAEFSTQARPLEAATNALSATLSGIKALQFHVIDNNLGALSARVEEMRKAVDEQVGVIALELKKADESNAAKAGQEADALRSEIAGLQAQLGTLGAQFEAQLARVEFAAKEEAKKLQLIPGPAGEAGASLNPRGTFIDGQTYNRLDVVSWLGSSYIATVDGVTEKPSKTSTQWQVLASRGNGGGGTASLNDMLGAPSAGTIVGSEGSSYVRKTLVAGANIAISETPSTITITGTEGEISLEDGSAAAPSLFFTNDPDTGIYRPGSNQVGISLGGSAQAVLTSTTFTVTPNLVVSGTGTSSIGGNATVAGTLRVATKVIDTSGGYLYGGSSNDPGTIGAFGDLSGNAILTISRATGNDATLGAGFGNLNLAAVSNVKTGNVFQVTNTTASSSTSSGALVVSGGVGVAGALYVGSKGQFQSNDDALSLKYSTDGGSCLLAWKNTSGTTLWSIGGGIDTRQHELVFRRGSTTVLNLNNSNNATFAGTLTVSGGSVTLTGAAYPNFYSDGSSGGAFTIRKAGVAYGTLYGNETNTILDSAGSANLIFQTGGATRGTFTSSGLTVNATTASTSTSTGALVVGGGVGVAGAINAGGNLTVSGGKASLTSAGNQTLEVISSSGAAQAIAFFQGSGGGGGIIAHNSSQSLRIGRASDSALTGYTDEIFIAASNGNVLLGTTTDIGGKLQINKSNGGNVTGAANAAIYLPTDESTIQGPGTYTQIRMGGNLVLGSSNETLIQVNQVNAIKITSSQQVQVNATTASTSTSTGALVVSGGVGVAGAINAGGTLTVNGKIRNDPNTSISGDVAGSISNLSATGYGLRVQGGASGSGYILSANDYTGSEKFQISGAGNATFAGNITTAAPAGGTAAAWKLGTVATVSPTSPNRTIEVDIGGTIYYIHAKTTNN